MVRREVKCYFLRLPFLSEDLKSLFIFKENSISQDVYTFEILHILKDKQFLERRLSNFKNEIFEKFKLISSDILFNEVEKEIEFLINTLLYELSLENLYDEKGCLPFNALWFECTDSLMFYVMSKADVDQ